ncbi:hypothetical protein ACS0TY_025706 [Phlomoides rotata]
MMWVFRSSPSSGLAGNRASTAHFCCSSELDRDLRLICCRVFPVYLLRVVVLGFARVSWYRPVCGFNFGLRRDAPLVFLFRGRSGNVVLSERYDKFKYLNLSIQILHSSSLSIHKVPLTSSIFPRSSSSWTCAAGNSFTVSSAAPLTRLWNWKNAMGCTEMVVNFNADDEEREKACRRDIKGLNSGKGLCRYLSLVTGYSSSGEK